MRELPLDNQITVVRQIIKQLMDIYKDINFSSDDIKNPPFAKQIVLKRLNLPKVLSHLESLKEIKIVDNIGSIVKFQVTELFGNLPSINVQIPVYSHVIANFESSLVQMMTAYGLIASFENKLRFFLASTLEKSKGTDWWDKSIPQSVKKNIKSHRLQQWHIELPKSNIQYTDFSDLISIIINNWDIFQPIFKDQSLIKTYLESLEIPRNTIAHSNVLSSSMFKELELYISKILNLINI